MRKTRKPFNPERYHRPYPLSNRFFSTRTGKVVLLEGYADRNLNPVWAAHLREARRLEIGMPMVVAIKGRFIRGRKVGILGTFTD